MLFASFPYLTFLLVSLSYTQVILRLAGCSWFPSQFYPSSKKDYLVSVQFHSEIGNLSEIFFWYDMCFITNSNVSGLYNQRTVRSISCRPVHQMALVLPALLFVLNSPFQKGKRMVWILLLLILSGTTLCILASEPA